MFGFLTKIFGSAQDRAIKRYRAIVEKINHQELSYQGLSDEAIKAKTQEFKERLKAGESLDSLLVEAYAVVKNTCRRLCGTEIHVSGYNQRWDMVPYDVQLIAAIGMHYGCVAEMMTGEGKTLTASLPLYLNALTGDPVHLVTVNDYLCDRDCQWVGSIFRWLGLTTGVLTNSTPAHTRKEVYSKDIIYGTSSEFGFDYLRDNSMAQSAQEQVQRGHYFALIDEVDSILIDEARTPLIISGPAAESRQLYDQLKGGVAYVVGLQRDCVNKLAQEANKALSREYGTAKEKKLAWQQAAKELWRVSKGMPTHKVVKRAQEDPEVRAMIDSWETYFHSEHAKEEKHAFLAELYVTIDQKTQDQELTDKGIAEWVRFSKAEHAADDFMMLDLGTEFMRIDASTELSEEDKALAKTRLLEDDAVRKERAHNIRQLFKAHLLMEKDVDYIIDNHKIVIVDTHTGRLQPGRRFSDGLHQAIEAKEGVAIQRETQTYATITLQNYFRMYKKLSGMTGTGITEEHEFKEIYNLEVLQIPTHLKCKRVDLDDEVYMTAREKYNAIVLRVQEAHAKGQPILIGTESVAVSELLSRVFKSKNLPHSVLNARYHEKEAEVVAQAGRKGAITISTNMAGRGTDIKLDPEAKEAGGLMVIGTTRHESRRIDRQLRGRCSRQGDPGTSLFYVSFEDDLMRMFAGSMAASLLQKMRPAEGEVISHRMLTRRIEGAQKRVEQAHYAGRKNTLEYDDVMNRQRKEIYGFRNEILHGTDLEALAVRCIENACWAAAEKSFSETKPELFRQQLALQFPVVLDKSLFEKTPADRDVLVPACIARIQDAFREKLAADKARLKLLLEQSPMQAELGSEEAMDANITTGIRNSIRYIMISRLDTMWKSHLLRMDHLRSDVHMRSYAQKHPLQEYKLEGFALFEQLGLDLLTKILQGLFKMQINVNIQPRPAPQPAQISASGNMDMLHKILDAAKRQRDTQQGS